MAYCIKCGKEIEDGKRFCDEHSPEAATQFAGAPVPNGYFAPIKKAPLWMFPVGALVAAAASGILSVIGTTILQAVIWEIDFVDSDFLMYLFNGQIIPTIVFFVLTFGTVILYNKSCSKNGLEDSAMPVYYGGIFYVCRAVTSIVGGLLSSVTWLVLGIISEVSYLPFEFYDVYGIINGIAGVINAILFILVSFFVFTFIHKKQTKK